MWTVSYILKNWATLTYYVKSLVRYIKSFLVYYLVATPLIICGACILFISLCFKFDVAPDFTKENINKIISEKSDKELISYIEPFFVGLLEGDGTITVDYISDRNKRVRVFIALKNLEANRFMLNLIVKYIGGRVAIERNSRYVTWYATNKTSIAKVLAVLSKYPLLTTRKQCQLNFAKDFVNSTNVLSKEEFNRLRDDKYKDQKAMLDSYNKNVSFTKKDYFPAWLSGFTEAEGHFKLVKKINNTISSSQFIIGQNYENYLLKEILTYFKQENKKISFTLNKEGVTYYRIHLSGKIFRSLLVSHFNKYPLLGDKYNKYIEWINKH